MIISCTYQIRKEVLYQPNLFSYLFHKGFSHEHQSGEGENQIIQRLKSYHKTHRCFGHLAIPQLPTTYQPTRWMDTKRIWIFL
jgi:hypothetical protein